MRFDLPSLYLTLMANQPLSIEGGLDTQIRVLEGRVWLTEEGVPEDVFLFAGSSYDLRTSGRVVLDCDTQARVELKAPVSVRSAHPLRDALASLRRVARRALSGPVKSGGAAFPRGL